LGGSPAGRFPFFGRPRDIAALQEWCAPQRKILDDLLLAAGITYADKSP
jgi:hypothetical protein